MAQHSFPQHVRIVEVGPRDGLQNEPQPISTERKVQFIRELVAAGLREIEATSFVQATRVPQLADADELIPRVRDLPGAQFSALTPNERGLERALEAGLRRIAVFTGATDSFTRKNINMSIEESLEVFAPVVRRAREAGVSARGYVSVSFICPYEGDVPAEKVRAVTARLFELGVDEVSLSDTIGAAAPTDIYRTLEPVLAEVPVEQLALHLHDTYGTALANALAGLELGIATFDSSAGGLGGCPFAPGAAGNVATEDLVYMLDRMGIATGVDCEKVVEAASDVTRQFGRELTSRQYRRLRRAECGANLEPPGVE
jgi:hydroxymethylglutaryl-CoA lyase